jgi:hypothetical protein
MGALERRRGGFDTMIIGRRGRFRDGFSSGFCFVGLKRRLGGGMAAVARVFIVIARNVSRLLRALQLRLILLNHLGLNHFAAFGIDRMRDVGVKLRPALMVAGERLFGKLEPALVAVSRPQVVFEAAVGAMRHELSARHGDKGTARALDDF